MGPPPVGLRIDEHLLYPLFLHLQKMFPALGSDHLLDGARIQHLRRETELEFDCAGLQPLFPFIGEGQLNDKTPLIVGLSN